MPTQNNLSVLDIAKRYFDLSNQSNVSAINHLFTEEAIYISENMGSYKGRAKIIAMQKDFHDKFVQLAWSIDRYEIVDEMNIIIYYTFNGLLKNNESIVSSGIERITIDGDRISKVDIKNI